METSSYPKSDDTATDSGQASDLSSTADVNPLECNSQTHLFGEKEVDQEKIIYEKIESKTSENSQVFWKTPPAKAVVPIGGGPLCNNVIDWSRNARTKRLLVKAGTDINQMLLTQYYGIVDEIEVLAQSNDILSTLKNQESNVLPFSPVLIQIISNAERNAMTLSQEKRYPEVLKKFATALFIYSGPLTYEFLQCNLHQALLSLHTIQRMVHVNYNAVNGGEFRFDGLATHIAKHNTTNIVTIGEDATHIICRVEYDAKTNPCVGFVLPLKGGLPVIDSFLATSFDAIENMFADNTLAKYAYVYMAQPLAQNVPAYCLACFGTDNKFTAELILQRWQYILKECERSWIRVVSFRGDGDSRLIKAMRVSVSIFSKQTKTISLVPSLKTSSIPSQWTSWFWVLPFSNVYN